jgi:cell division protein ZapA
VASTRGVSVELGGQTFRIRSDASADQLQRMAQLVNSALARVSGRAKTIDTRDLALLTALQLARELDEERSGTRAGPSDERLGWLADQIENEIEEVRGRCG